MTIGLLVIARRNGTCYVLRNIVSTIFHYYTNIIIHLIQSRERAHYENFFTRESVFLCAKDVYSDTFYFISKRYSLRICVFISPRYSLRVNSLAHSPSPPPKKEKQPRLSIVNDIHSARHENPNLESRVKA